MATAIYGTHDWVRQLGTTYSKDVPVETALFKKTSQDYVATGEVVTVTTKCELALAEAAFGACSGSVTERKHIEYKIIDDGLHAELTETTTKYRPMTEAEKKAEEEDPDGSGGDGGAGTEEKPSVEYQVSTTNENILLHPKVEPMSEEQKIACSLYWQNSDPDQTFCVGTQWYRVGDNLPGWLGQVLQKGVKHYLKPVINIETRYRSKTPPEVAVGIVNSVAGYSLPHGNFLCVGGGLSGSGRDTWATARYLGSLDGWDETIYGTN